MWCAVSNDAPPFGRLAFNGVREVPDSNCDSIKCTFNIPAHSSVAPSHVRRARSFPSSLHMSLRQRRGVEPSPVSPEPQEMARHSDPHSRDPWGQRNSAATEAFAKALVNAVKWMPMVLWGVVLLAGTTSYRGPEAAAQAHFPLAWYDAVFVRFGPLFFLAPLGLRAFSDVADEVSSPTPARALVVYAIVGVVRIGVYLIGVGLGSGLMSDHLFLGASVVAAAHGEAIACAATALRLVSAANGPSGGRGRRSRVRIAIALVASVAGACVASTTLVLQCWDAYCTAAYFHAPRETLVAWILGLALTTVAAIGVILPASRSLGYAILEL